MISLVAKWVALFFACLIAQSTLMPVIAIQGVSPDVLMLTLFVFSVKFGVAPGVFAGFFLGLGEDLFAPSVLGQNALAKTITGGCVGVFNERVMRTDPLLRIAILLVSFVVHDILVYAVELVRNGAPVGALFSILLTKTVPRAFYSTVILSVAYLWEYFVKSPSARG